MVSGAQPAALIIHVDADVADEDEIDCRTDCPPAGDTVDALRDVLLQWAGEEAVPDGVVLCIPSKSTEAWVLAALHPKSKFVGPALECKDEPAALLVNRPEKLVRRRRGDSGYQKNRKAYEDAAPRIAEAWPFVCETCSQAARFATEMAASVER